MVKPFMVAVFLLCYFLVPFSVNAQFGQNKVQYRDFNWHFLQTEHFDIYFYPGGYEIAVFTADVAEDAYVLLKRDFNYEINKRVSIVLYKSHNDFQQTNVVSVYMPEGVGGVTELYKNRVVVPFEGSYSQFRHVIHHELVHAVMNDMLYGGSVQSLISGRVSQMPLWFSEGLAEYLSQRWNTKTDMMVRDATIGNYLVAGLGSIGAYYGGNSFFRFIAEKYGNEKIGEILHKIKGSFRFDNAFKSALGIDVEELLEDWQKKMRKEYWPDIADRDESGDFGRALTDHKEDKSYLNISPALSPTGEKMAFLSNRGGKQGIFVMDMLDNENIEKVIEGETDINFEELHWLSPGMGWSPDATKLTFSAKAGDQDALYIYDIASKKIVQHKFDLDGLFSAAWSPTEDKVAFIGNFNGEGNLYVYNLETDEIEKITSDAFSDTYPRWSNDGKKIAFVSERGRYTVKDSIPENFAMSKHNYENTDIYIVDIETKEIKRITSTPFLESDPIFSPDDSELIYVSDDNGISNIFIHDLDTNERYAISNLLSGAFQLSIDKNGETLLFTSYNEMGFDIFSIKNPFDLPAVELQNTVFFNKLEDSKSLLSTVNNLNELDVKEDSTYTKVDVPQTNNYGKYVFADLDRKSKKRVVDVAIGEDEYKREDGNYKVRNYKVKFTPDIINGQAGYSNIWGIQGWTSLMYSDVLGNHQIGLGTNLNFSLSNSYLVFEYYYLPERVDYGGNVFHIANEFSYNGLIHRYRNYGFDLIASRPFSKFTRISFALSQSNASIEKTWWDDPSIREFSSVSTIQPSISLIHDTSEWPYYLTGPNRGFRGMFMIKGSPKYSKNSFQFTTIKADLRQYFKLHDLYSFAFRLNSGISFGKNPQQFLFGGVQNWINRKTPDGGNVYDRLDGIEDVYFSEFIMPVRGATLYEKAGTKFALFNGEFRFPLITNLGLGIPPVQLGFIQGVLFTDVGSAWSSDDDFKGVSNGKTRDLFIGYGTGARLALGFLFKYDLSWEYNFKKSSRARHYFSIGVDF